MPQTSVSLNPSRGAAGQLNTGAPHFIESLICDEATGVKFGKAVVLKSGAGKTVDLPLTGETCIGVAVRDMSKPTNDGAFADGDELPVLRYGVVHVQVEDAVVKGAAPFIRIATGDGGTELGSFRSDGDTDTAEVRTGWEFLDNGAAGEYVRVLVTV
jgi:hypothetical protein